VRSVLAAVTPTRLDATVVFGGATVGGPQVTDRAPLGLRCAASAGAAGRRPAIIVIIVAAYRGEIGRRRRPDVVGPPAPATGAIGLGRGRWLPVATHGRRLWTGSALAVPRENIGGVATGLGFVPSPTGQCPLGPLGPLGRAAGGTRLVGQRRQPRGLGVQRHPLYEHLATEQDPQVLPQRLQLGAQAVQFAADLVAHLLLDLPPGSRLDLEFVRAPRGHLAFELELVDFPQLICPIGVYEKVAPVPRRSERAGQCRPERGNHRKPQPARLLGQHQQPHGKYGQRRHRDQQDPTSRRAHTAPGRPSGGRMIGNAHTLQGTARTQSVGGTPHTFSIVGRTLLAGRHRALGVSESSPTVGRAVLVVLGIPIVRSAAAVFQPDPGRDQGQRAQGADDCAYRVRAGEFGLVAQR
jgi:hypothetical protein